MDGQNQEDEYMISSDRKVFVSNISFQVRTGELKDFFRYFGRVVQVNLLRDRNRRRSRGLAFITFGAAEEATKAKAASQYELTLDGRVMKCSDVEKRPRRQYEYGDPGYVNRKPDNAQHYALQDVGQYAQQEAPQYVPQHPQQHAMQSAQQNVQQYAPQNAQPYAPQNTPQYVPQNAPQYAQQSAPQYVPQNAPQYVQQSIPQNVQQNVPQYAPQNVPQHVQQPVPQNVPQTVPQSRPAPEQHAVRNYSAVVMGHKAPVEPVRETKPVAHVAHVAIDTTVDSLPEQLLIKIFNFLSIKERFGVESVCKRWQRASQATWVSQRSLHFSGVFKGGFTDEGVVALTDNILKSILSRGCQNLRHLDLSASPRLLTARSLNSIGQVCKELRYLNLSNSKIDSSIMKTLTEGCKKIETIVLKRCIELSEKGVWWLFHNCENLTYVDLEDNRRVNGKCFHILNKHCKVVLLEGCTGITDKGLECLATKCGESLEELNLSNCMIVSDTGFTAMTQRCYNLKVFRFNGLHSKVTPEGLRNINNLSKVHTLHLTNNQAVSDAALLTIARRCSRLGELKIDGCSFQNVTDAGIQSLAKCPNLVILNISYLAVTDTGMTHLALAGTLQKLVARSLHITDKVVRQLAAYCTRMYELDVCGCSALTVHCVQVFQEARQAMPSYEQPPTLTLNVGGTAVTEESLAELGYIDPSVIICLQNLTAPPGQYYPAILPREDGVRESEEEEDEEEEVPAVEVVEQANADESNRPRLNPSAPSFSLNRHAAPYQVPADSNKPWDGIANPEVAGSGPAGGVPGQFNAAAHNAGMVPGHVMNQDAGSYHGQGPPTYFAKVDPRLAEYQAVEEALMGGAYGGDGGEWVIPEECMDDFLDAHDPAYMHDAMFPS